MRRQHHLARVQQGRPGAGEVRQGPAARRRRHDAAAGEGQQAAKPTEEAAAARRGADRRRTAGDRRGVPSPPMAPAPLAAAVAPSEAVSAPIAAVLAASAAVLAVGRGGLPQLLRRPEQRAAEGIAEHVADALAGGGRGLAEQRGERPGGGPRQGGLRACR